MARWKEFVISLEPNFDDCSTIAELQDEYDIAIQNEDYKEAGKIKKLIDAKVASGDDDTEKYLDESCWIDLHEVNAFYQGEFEDKTKFVRVCLKSGETIPVTMTIEEFKHIFFNA
jgi:hypothetical protein